MIDPHNVSDVAEGETVARYVLQRSHVRRSDNTVKPDAFVPHPHGELSVTRHLSATEDELWSVGRDVAAKTAKTLYGRADISVAACLVQKLLVKAAPLSDNPNHADISDWPSDKPSQKIIAIELAEAALYLDRP